MCDSFDEGHRYTSPDSELYKAMSESTEGSEHLGKLQEAFEAFHSSGLFDIAVFRIPEPRAMEYFKKSSKSD